jgi:hypothetical protein
VKVRSGLKGSLRKAVLREAAGDSLHVRITRQIRQLEAEESDRNHWKAWMAIAAVFLMSVAGGWLVLNRSAEPWRLSAAEQESYVESLFSRVAATIRIGLGDHVHCVHFRQFATATPTRDQIVEKLGPVYSELAETVRDKIPHNYDLALAHQCSYRGRRYAHLVFRGDGELLSLVVTRRDAAESFESDGLVPVLRESGIPLYRADAEDFDVAGFETPGHLVFMISNIGDERNLELAASVAGATHEFLAAIEDGQQSIPRSPTGAQSSVQGPPGTFTVSRSWPTTSMPPPALR